ncbi:Uncharacterized protein GBIM_01352, partial [Gryllus bimaculatus]
PLVAPLPVPVPVLEAAAPAAGRACALAAPRRRPLGRRRRGRRRAAAAVAPPPEEGWSAPPRAPKDAAAAHATPTPSPRRHGQHHGQAAHQRSSRQAANAKSVAWNFWEVVLENTSCRRQHAKKVKSQEILRQLQSSGQTFSRDEKTKILKCEVCDVVVNSSQQLQTHLAGNKHKQKVLKKAAQGGQSKLGPSAGVLTTVNAIAGSHPPGGPDAKGE